MTKGIQWAEGLSWQEVREKAKRTNKYIFLDCYTTWCGPCKMMDKDVYPTAAVGDFVNDKFISIRVQMDQSENDNAFVKSWHKDAEEINKRYLIEGYPTFLFFSPSGAIIHKEIGFRNVEKFITMAQIALTPGKIFNDDYTEYTQFMTNYKRGDIKYERLPFMVTIAKKLGDTVSRQLVRLHEQYVSNLPAKERYTKENITFWASLNLTGDRKIVQFYYQDGEQIDRVMQKKGYAQTQVNKWIQLSTVLPFIIEQLQNLDKKSDATTINAETGAMISDKTDYHEADWKKLQTLIRKNFGKSYIKSNLLQAKATWYKKNSNWPAYAMMSFEKFKIDPPDFEVPLERVDMNSLGWHVFLFVKDKELINDAIIWMKKLIESPSLPSGSSEPLDTYANLLYKAGRKEDAIYWQEKAVIADPNRKTRQIALEQMKKGEPTYGVTR
jgi:thioredoxin-related protein